MRKFEIEHLKTRVSQVVRCTNGEVATKLQKKLKGTGLTDKRKLEMIRNGKAVLKDDLTLSNTTTYSAKKYLFVLLDCYDFPLTEIQKEKIRFNEGVNSRMKELQTEVEMEGRRIIDEAILGIIEVKEIPKRLQELGRMSSIA